MHKSIYLSSFIAYLFTFGNLNAGEVNDDIMQAIDLEEAFALSGKKNQHSNHLKLTKKDHIPTSILEEETICYLEGYIQALIDANYYETYVVVAVDEDRVVYLYNLPSDQRIKNSIIAFVKDIPGITDVQERKLDRKAAAKVRALRYDFHLTGVWFPESTVLFEPLIANPRDPVYSIAYRWGDEILANYEIAISLGDIFPIYRFFDVWGGDVQIDIGACMWANFNMDPDVNINDEWAELVTTDYILSIPVSYSRDNYSFRLRIYHISSHLGDEFMVHHPEVLRRNPSFEAIDFFGSIQFQDSMRFYLGPGVIINSDASFPMKYFYFEYGFEFRPLVTKYKHPRLYGYPFLAIDVQNWQLHNYRPSLTIQLGYEWSKLERAGRNVRIFGEYHNGYSEGQFFDQITDYLAIRAAWGF
ncbi:MAG: hypothetical protein S4CHLAM20_11160 [Chlamydiia bacterium]|nr:hypothetical protein [Chlamydiia bacterium]